MPLLSQSYSLFILQPRCSPAVCLPPGTSTLWAKTCANRKDNLVQIDSVPSAFITLEQRLKYACLHSFPIHQRHMLFYGQVALQGIMTCVSNTTASPEVIAVFLCRSLNALSASDLHLISLLGKQWSLGLCITNALLCGGRDNSWREKK